MDLLERLERMLLEDRLLNQGDRIVAAVSGGPDSTALLHLLFLLSPKWGWTLTVAHANHGFRPEESAREAEFVRRQADELGLPFIYKELDVPGHLREHGGNPQDAARELRYRFLTEAARAAGAEHVVLAHHADDQAETVLMRVLRGTGISGLAGIPAKRMEQNVELVRPLLRITKNEILEWLHQSGIGSCTDSSNRKTKYTRNSIRLEALPMLQRYNPSLVQALNRLSGLAASEDDYMEREAARVFEAMARPGKDGVRFGREAFAGLHVALQRRFLKLILNYVSSGSDSPDFGDVERVRTALLQAGKPNAELWNDGAVRLVREYEDVRLLKGGAEAGQVSYRYPVEGPEGEIWIPEASCRMVYRTVPPGEMPAASPHTVCFDAERLGGPLLFRNRMNGDRMRPDGLNGSKKVKDILIDRKVPLSVRERTPVLTDGEGTVLWLPGIRRSDAAKVAEDTRLVMCLQCLPV